MTTITSKLAAIACTIVVSATMIFGAVGPATAVGHDTHISRVA
ncbi:hypothetical protein [Sphingomonas sp.]